MGRPGVVFRGNRLDSPSPSPLADALPGDSWTAVHALFASRVPAGGLAIYAKQLARHSPTGRSLPAGAEHRSVAVATGGPRLVVAYCLRGEPEPGRPVPRPGDCPQSQRHAHLAGRGTRGIPGTSGA